MASYDNDTRLHHFPWERLPAAMRRFLESGVSQHIVAAVLLSYYAQIPSKITEGTDLISLQPVIAVLYHEPRVLPAERIGLAASEAAGEPQPALSSRV
jgi:hypothetical protein